MSELCLKCGSEMETTELHGPDGVRNGSLTYCKKCFEKEKIMSTKEISKFYDQANSVSTEDEESKLKLSLDDKLKNDLAGAKKKLHSLEMERDSLYTQIKLMNDQMEKAKVNIEYSKTDIIRIESLIKLNKG